MILDLHLHSELSDDSRAPVEAYLKLLARKRDERPLDGIVLTEHRQFDLRREYRTLEDRYGFLVLNAAEVETDYGHVLVYGVNEDILARFDFRDVRLPAQELLREVERLGGIALPCHPGRPNVGLCAHYETKPPLEGVVAVEALNGGSRKGEDARVQTLIERHVRLPAKKTACLRNIGLALLGVVLWQRFMNDCRLRTGQAADVLGELENCHLARISEIDRITFIRLHQAI